MSAIIQLLNALSHAVKYFNAEKFMNYILLSTLEICENC